MTYRKLKYSKYGIGEQEIPVWEEHELLKSIPALQHVNMHLSKEADTKE